MALTWTPVAQADFWDAYLDWSRLLQTRRGAARGQKDDTVWYEPVFVRLTAQKDMVRARRALRDLVDDATSPFLMEPDEYAFLGRQITDGGAAGHADEYALYRRLDDRDAARPALFQVVDVGVPVDLSGPAETVPADTDTAAPPCRGAPIVAVIDDGIAFLNSRFTRLDADGQRRTRLHAVWLQAAERLCTEPGSSARAHLGRELSAAEIDGWLALSPALDEAAVYSALNGALYGAETRRSTDFAFSHGTHVLDLAAGAEPDDSDDPVRDWPLLAVQLPPEAIEDTSGTRFESYIVQAVRWTLRRAAEIDATAPVIVNLSMGILAGPKDGTRFAEWQITREARQWEAATGQPVRIVWCFGNTYRSRLVARFDYPQADHRSATDRQITWRVQPEDQTASYLEIRPESGTPSDALQIALVAPGGETSGFAAMPPGSVRTLDANGVPVARIYHVPSHDLGDGAVQQPYCTIALAPTGDRIPGEPLAPAGAWQVMVRYKDDAALRVDLQIQRDDSLRGYRSRARQSYFDSPDAYGWDMELMAHVGLERDSPIRHDGTLNALATATARQVFAVGAARRNAQAGVDEPALYTAEGAAWTVAAPHVGAVADEGTVLLGVLGAGNLSGSVELLDGTSAAAARISRALGLSAGRIVANAGGDQTDDLDPRHLTLTPVAPEDRARLGAYLVEPPAHRIARR